MEKEYLLLGNTRETRRIDSSDICYIRAVGNNSAVFLTKGDYILITMQLGIIKYYCRDKFLTQAFNLLTYNKIQAFFDFSI